MNYPKTNKRNLEGHVIGIPINDKCLQSLVIWHSKYFKNVILLAVTDLQVDKETDTTEIGNFITFIFTGAQIIRSGYWKLNDKVEIDLPQECFFFRSASEVFYKDENKPGYKGEVYLKLEAYGRVAVENYLEDLLEGKELGILSQETFEDSQKLIKRIKREC